MAGEHEEQFLFRVHNDALAERIRHVLREDPAARPEDADMEVLFEGAVRHKSWHLLPCSVGVSSVVWGAAAR